MRIVLAVLTIAVLTGCASPKYNYQPQSTDVSFPKIGQRTTVGVGDIMVRQGNYVEKDSIEISRTITVGLIGAYSFSPGYYTKVGEDIESEFYLPERSSEGGLVSSSALADPFEAIQIMKGTQTICGVTVLGGKVCEDSSNFRRVKRASTTVSGFQQALIYSGKVGNRINIGYREFSNNMARPAFNNDVEYDLRDGKEIGYKGAVIEIIEANNRSITYKVIRNFN